MVQIQPSGQGGGAAEQVGDLGGESVDKVQQVRPAVVPAGLPVAQRSPDGPNLAGRLFRRLAPPPVVLGQFLQLLGGLHPVPLQQLGAPVLPGPSAGVVDKPRHQGEQKDETPGVEGIGQQLSLPDPADHTGNQGKQQAQSREQLGRHPLDPRGGQAGVVVGQGLLDGLDPLLPGHARKAVVLGRDLCLDIDLLRLLPGRLALAQFLVQHLQILQLSLCLLQQVLVGQRAVFGRLPLQGGQLAPGRLKLLPGLGKAPVQLSLGQSAVGRPLGGQQVSTGGQGGPLPLQQGDAAGQLLQLLQGLVHLPQLSLQPGDQPHASVDLSAVEPLPQPPLGLGVGHVLLPGGHQRGNTPLQLRGRCNRQISTRSNEGRPLKDLPSHTGEQLAAVGGSQAGDRLLRPGVDGGKGPEGSAALGTPAEGDVPALPLQVHSPLHGGAGPGLIPVLVRQIPLFIPVPGIDAIEHSLPKGGPGGFAPLVGGIDQI